jgi:hypothetical protein
VISALLTIFCSLLFHHLTGLQDKGRIKITRASCRVRIECSLGQPHRNA